MRASETAMASQMPASPSRRGMMMKLGTMKTRPRRQAKSMAGFIFSRLGKAVDGDAGGVALLADEQAYEGAGQEHEEHHADEAADDGGDYRQAADGQDAVHLAGSVVEADYRLGGLGHGVAEHEDEGGVVAG